MDSPLNKEAVYLPPHKSLWTGRKTNPGVGSLYWYQEVRLVDWEKLGISEENKKQVALVGYACDEGVIRNSGRSGARFGPQTVRNILAKFPVHFENVDILDVGDIVCENQELEEAQTCFSHVIHQLMANNVFPIAIGGGHDMAYGHFCGLRNYLGEYDGKKICVINLDAHFDIRPIEKQVNSGTPFNQILQESEGVTDYVVMGVQQQANTKELFDIADKYNVRYFLNYECEVSNIQTIKNVLQPIIDRNDYVFLSIDMDSFSSAYAPGVSAPSPLGFTPYFALNILTYLLQTGKVISCEIAELNPEVDKDNTTARLAACLIDHVVLSHSKL